MWDVFFNWLAENVPMIFVIILTGAVVAVVVWFLAGYYHRLKDVEAKTSKLQEDADKLPCDEREKQFSEMLEKKLDQLPCDEREKQFSEMLDKKLNQLPCDRREEQFSEMLEKKLDKLPCDKYGESFNKILEELTTIRTFLITKNPTAATVFSQKNSPRELNEAGEQLFSDIGGQHFVDNNKTTLLKWIENKEPKTALDVELIANAVLLENLESEIFNDLKSWVYASKPMKLMIDGEEKDYTVTMNDVCFVLSIKLRDLFLNEHKEIKK